VSKLFRYAIQNVFKITGVGSVAVGKVVSGSINEGATVRLSPSEFQSRTGSIQTIFKEKIETASVGSTVRINLKNVQVNELKEGCSVICNGEKFTKIKEFKAKLFICKSL
jgi:translation elongation factor EF-1alpha